MLKTFRALILAFGHCFAMRWRVLLEASFRGFQWSDGSVRVMDEPATLRVGGNEFRRCSSAPHGICAAEVRWPDEGRPDDERGPHLGSAEGLTSSPGRLILAVHEARLPRDVGAVFRRISGGARP